MTMNVEINGERLTLYNLTKYILDYDQLTDIHKEWCDEYEKQKMNNVRRFVNLKPRGTFKSTILTIGNVIDLLIDDFVKNNGIFTTKILICSATDTLAANLLSEISEHLEKNEKLLDIFDPDRQGYIARSNKNGIWFKNRKISKEANITCVGALASIVGMHVPVLIMDDVSNQDDRESAAIRERKWRWFQDILSIQTINEQTLTMVTGTVWHFDDILQRIIRMNEELDDEFKYHIEIDGVYNEDGSLRYPTIYNYAELENLKKTKGKIQFCAQYENRVLSEDTMIFDYNTFSFYKEGTIDFNYANHFIYTDPSLGKEMDYSVILVGAIYNKDLYIRNAIISNTIKSSELIKQVDRLNKEYCCIKCGLETNGFQSLLLENVKELNITNKKYKKNIINIEEVKNYKNKQIRIESIEPFIVSGRVHFREDWEMVYPLLIEQLVNYPVTSHDDAPDALEGLIRITINNKFRNANSITADKLKQFSKSIKMRR